MNNSRWARFAPLTGLGFVVLLAAGVVTINFYEFMPSAADAKAFFEANALRTSVGAYLVLLSAVPLLWFVGSLRSALRSAEGGSGRLSAVAFGGGVVAAAAVMAAMSATLTVSERGRIDGVIPGDYAIALQDFSGNLFGGMAAFALGLMIAATAVVAYRTGFLPRWAVWLSWIIVVGSFSPLAYIFVGISVIWIAVVSVVLYGKGQQTPTGSP